MTSAMYIPSLPGGRADARRLLHNSNKSWRVQAGAPDERAVDLGLRDEPVHVLGLDAAAVEDPDRLRDLLRGELREQAAQVPVDLAGLARRRVDSGADRPHRLVRSEEHTSELQSQSKLLFPL